MPIHTYIDAQTGETTQFEMTGSELAEYEANTAAALAQLAVSKQLEEKKTAVLAKLGLTAEEVAALLS